MAEEKEYIRFSKNVRIQHIGLMITFIIQIISGFPLSFPNTWWSKVLITLMGGWEMRTQIHHISGVVMVILGVYHVIFILQSRRGKNKKPLKMFPKDTDFKEFINYLKHIFGFGPEPKYDRYNWKEKFEYWGVVWGTIIMGLTGLILMFPFTFMRYMPLAWIHLSSLVHFYEAVLASLVVLIWHFYNVHFHPEWFMQKTWINGKISEEHMKGHHPLELEELK